MTRLGKIHRHAVVRPVLFVAAVACVAIIACSNNSSTKDAPTGKQDAPGSGSGTALTVKNYDAWCSVQVGSGTASTSSAQTVNVTPGSITLKATALSGFILGDWHHTSGDTGSGDPGTVTGTGSSAVSTATVTVGSAATCVWVCCPFTNGTGCPTTDQCP